MTNKTEVRESLLRKRGSLTDSQVAIASHGIIQPIIEIFKKHDFKKLHLYSANKKLNEIDPKHLAEELRAKFPLLSITFGDPNPRATFSTEEFDVIILPVVGFDNHNNRLGMGGGWYDRWLITQTDSYKIGLAYSWARLEHLPTEPHDIRLDKIVTD